MSGGGARSGRGLILAALALVLPAVVGAAITLVVLPPVEGAGGKESAAGVGPPSEPQLFAIEPVVVNLQGSGAQRYLKVGVAFEWRAQDAEAAKARFERKLIILKDRLIACLGAKTLRAVDSSGGKELLKQELLEAFNTILFPDGGGKIERILYSDFIIQ